MKLIVKIKYLFIIYKVFLILGILITVASCSDRAAIENPVISKPLKVGARMSATSISRDYLSEEPVVEGTYTLAYINTANSYNLANVNFGLEGITPSIGIVSIPSTDGNSELTWNKIGGGTDPTFYLDNVPLEKSDSTDPLTVTFTNDYNPFVAAVFDSENGTNDLLWGTKSENRNVNTLNFDLHHNMARLQVIVTVDRSNSADDKTLNLEGATVSISNLILEPLSYNRADGSLSLKEEPIYETFTLVSQEVEELDWFTSVPDELNSNITYYTTQDFVLPPQNLLEDSNRPRLKITLANGKVYSGVIPYAMTVIDSTYPEPGYPMTLTFLKEHILTIRTLVTEEPPELIFMPVYVVEWVDKGEFFLDGHQAGIYSAAEFYNMIKYYKKDEETRNYQLQRYGTYSNGSWTFVLWNTITLEYSNIWDQISDTAVSDTPAFHFSFSGFGVYVTNNEDTKQVNEQQLYQIVTGKLGWDSIKSN